MNSAVEDKKKKSKKKLGSIRYEEDNTKDSGEAQRQGLT